MEDLKVKVERLLNDLTDEDIRQVYEKVCEDITDIDDITIDEMKKRILDNYLEEANDLLAG